MKRKHNEFQTITWIKHFYWDSWGGLNRISDHYLWLWQPKKVRPLMPTKLKNFNLIFPSRYVSSLSNKWLYFTKRYSLTAGPSLSSSRVSRDTSATTRWRSWRRTKTAWPFSNLIWRLGGSFGESSKCQIFCLSLLTSGALVFFYWDSWLANLMTENGNVKIIKYRYILKIIGLGM